MAKTAAANKPAGNKPAGNKPAGNKPTPKAVQPKKQVANNATKKENKPVANAPNKQQNQKRKREENGSSAVHDVDKKMKETSEGGVVSTVGKRIFYNNVPESATLQDFKDLFANLPKQPHFKFLSYRNKERVGTVIAFFRDEESFNVAATMTELKLKDQDLKVQVNLQLDPTRSVCIPNFPGSFDANDIEKFFEGLEITNVMYGTHPTGKVSGVVYVEFANEQMQQAAISKSTTEFIGKPVTVAAYETNRPKPTKVAKPQKVKPVKKPQAKSEEQSEEKMELTDEKTVAKKAKQPPAKKQPPAAKKPAQSKPSPAKKPNQKKPAAPGKKNAANKPGAKSPKKVQKAPAAKAQKKN